MRNLDIFQTKKKIYGHDLHESFEVSIDSKSADDEYQKPHLANDECAQVDRGLNDHVLFANHIHYDEVVHLLVTTVHKTALALWVAT